MSILFGNAVPLYGVGRRDGTHWWCGWCGTIVKECQDVCPGCGGDLSGRYCDWWCKWYVTEEFTR